MKAKFPLLAMAIVVLAAVVAFAAYNLAGIRPASANASLDGIAVPDGFSISVFAGNLGSSSASYPGPNNGPRFMAHHNGTLLVSLMKQGKVAALPDANND